MSVTKIVIVSDSFLFSTALQSAFAQASDVQIFATMSQMPRDGTYDDAVIIVDSGNVAAIIEELIERSPYIDLSRTIILMRGDQSALEFGRVIGKIGAIMPNGSTSQEIVLATQIVRQGITLLPSEVGATFAFSSPAVDVELNGGSNRNICLSDREEGVLLLLSEGASNKMIARKLDIRESTVRVHVRAILKKLKLQNRTQAALYAVERRHNQPRV